MAKVSAALADIAAAVPAAHRVLIARWRRFVSSVSWWLVGVISCSCSLPSPPLTALSVPRLAGPAAAYVLRLKVILLLLVELLRFVLMIRSNRELWLD